MKCPQIEEVIILFTLIQKKIEGHTKSLSLTNKETAKKDYVITTELMQP